MYFFHQVFCAIIWGHTANEPECRLRTTDTELRQLPLFAVHRRALRNLNTRSRRIIATFWHERLLFKSASSAGFFFGYVGNTPCILGHGSCGPYRDGLRGVCYVVCRD